MKTRNDTQHKTKDLEIRGEDPITKSHTPPPLAPNRHSPLQQTLLPSFQSVLSWPLEGHPLVTNPVEGRPPTRSGAVPVDEPSLFSKTLLLY